MASLDDATVGLLAKRAYDVAGCASGFKGKPLKVRLTCDDVCIHVSIFYICVYVTVSDM